MIRQEFYKTRKDGVDLYRTYSDLEVYIKQIETGNEYIEAIDVVDENGKIRYTYEETDKKIEERSEEDEIEQ